ncbi:cupin domain-containing protein [Photobacterium sanctipauli]|uniref:Cupin domain-containing protein n=1 Tax=Photobacterium sanctipauli TaxID=1342794 RepID=A0A2T3NZV9_9GAMM|nr:cupin domain-containing protein [Photobacterium sanctipauli]PSW21797.1 cupin domain-containing protein [Photobacterium sanctipauli]
MTNNIFANIPSQLPQELFEDIVSTGSVRIERIVSKGHTTPSDEWYDQEEHEWVMVLQGEAKLLFEEGMREVEMKAGDHIIISAHQRHQVSWTKPDSETIWLAVFYK